MSLLLQWYEPTLKIWFNIFILTLEKDPYLINLLSFDLSKNSSSKSCPYTLEQNEIVEHKHYHIMQIAKSFLLSTNIPFML